MKIAALGFNRPFWSVVKRGLECLVKNSFSDKELISYVNDFIQNHRQRYY